MIEYKHGDLLQCDAEALVNTINCVGTMGKGIALAFKNKFPDNFKAYKIACDKKEIRPGKMFVYDMSDLFNKKYIINFPTKDHWRGRSKLIYIKEGLWDFVRVINELNIQSVAIPPLGCGNGGLQWNVVKPLIEESLQNIKHNITVYIYEPPKRFVVIQSNNILNPSRALLLCAMRIYQEPDCDDLSRLEAQKLAYLLQNIGEPLHLQFVKGLCGPFAKSLNIVLDELEVSGYIKNEYHSQSPEVGEIVLNKEKLKEAWHIIKNDPIRQKRLDKLRDIIFRFESSYGLELLATIHWIVCKNPLIINDIEKIIENVENWNYRKRTMFDSEPVRIAWKHLKNVGLI
ncbi:macro domain-containing protein [Megasphaera stantonii]|uniref:type II toxin-antitoxin system antitoxin DNA ADP-ribosyl glycohydrolase DarG n=1 Tax=Megasphaera stantonii TaxID=2144175 RepID=UPI00294376C0|nr:macro domain-containing protein [Megasphaera stantonii]